MDHIVDIDQDIKLEIINNFILYWETDERTQVRMMECAEGYVREDHVNELQRLREALR